MQNEKTMLFGGPRRQVRIVQIVLILWSLYVNSQKVMFEYCGVPLNGPKKTLNPKP